MATWVLAKLKKDYNSELFTACSTTTISSKQATGRTGDHRLENPAWQLQVQSRQ